DTAVTLGRRPVKPDQLVERLIRGGGVAARRERPWVEAVERLRRHAARRRDRQHFACQPDVYVAVGRGSQRVGNRVVGDGGRVEYRAVGHFAPQVTPDIARQDGAVVEV